MPTGAAREAELVKQTTTRFEHRFGHQPPVIALATDGGDVGFRPHAALVLKGLHQVAALIGTATGIAGALPKPGEKTRPEVGVVVRRGVGHAVGSQIGDRVKALVQRRGVRRSHGSHGGTVGEALTGSRVSAHPRLGLGALAFDARRVDNQVAHDRKPWERFDQQRAAFTDQGVEACDIGQHDPPVGANRRRWRPAAVTAAEGEATVEVTLHRLEEVLKRRVPGQSAGHGVES